MVYCLKQKFNVKKKKKLERIKYMVKNWSWCRSWCLFLNIQLTTAVRTSLRCFCESTIQHRAYNICLHWSALFCKSTESICVRTLALGGLYATIILGLSSKQLGFIMSPAGNGNPAWKEHTAITSRFFLLLACGSNVQVFSFCSLTSHNELFLQLLLIFKLNRHRARDFTQVTTK